MLTSVEDYFMQVVVPRLESLVVLGSPASTSIVGAGVAASGETGTAAPESSGEVISMSVRLGGGGGAEEAEGR